ncbi:Bromodomain containing protein [Histomonas meleagridis]|uniref:Bromodomain containing protein n=1 Tax=Histomonas meleagridis TaxID=135588 RepID=UPI003559B9CB|nr:Bromodomain containing protein [Histomonas meleagridis]KAH0798594.1 Bromodomain containing protein [Histomonas meleagridis]
MDSGTLTPTQKNACIKITNQLLSHPGSEIFSKPVESNLPNYYKIIDNPQDLGTILQRLQSDEYKSISEWEDAINTVWSNAKKFNGKNSYINFIAEYLSHKFQSYKKLVEILNLNDWIIYLYELKDEFDKLLENCPPSLKTIIPKALEGEIPLLPDFTSKDMNNLIAASQIVNDPIDVENVEDIIRKNDPSFNVSEKVLVVDVNNLSIKTLHEIRAYYQMKMVKLGMSYPNN